MEDLSEKLDRLLSSPDSLKQIEELMAAFGGTTDEAPTPAAPLPADAFGGEMLFKLLPLLSAFGQEDENAALLRALRPHLGKERQKRLDEAEKMMKLVRLLPLLKALSDEKEEE